MAKNNIGGIPKLSSSTTVLTISARSLLETEEVPPLIESAWGPGQPLGQNYPNQWFKSSEILKIMKCVRFIYETSDISVLISIFVGAAGPYTWRGGPTAFDLDVNIKPDPDCSGIIPGHVHSTGSAFPGNAYVQPTKVKFTGENMCTIASGSTTNWMGILSYAPPVLYKDFTGPGGHAGADLEWGIISTFYGASIPTIASGGYPVITLTPSGADTGAGISWDNFTGTMTCEGAPIAYGNNYPADPFELPPGYIPPPNGPDVTLQPINWQNLADELLTEYPNDPIMDSNGNEHLAQPYFNSFQISPTLPNFLLNIVAALDNPYFGTATYIIYIIAQPLIISDFSEYVTLIKAQYPNFASLRVMLYVDIGYLIDNGCELAPGVVENTISIVQDLCSQLIDYGFTYGGGLDYKGAADNFDTFKSNINDWVANGVNVQTSGPTE